MLHPEDTIVALSSAAGPGARAIVRLTGADALAVASTQFRSKGEIAADKRRWYTGEIRLPNVAAALPADLYLWPALRTYTGQELVELHTISSSPLVELLIAELIRAGARAAQPGEFTMRAFLAGKLDLPRAEAVLGVIKAGSRDELKQALTQLAGGVSQPLNALRDDLLNLLADLEAGLDFAEEDIHFINREELLLRLGKGLAQLANLSRQLEQRSISGRPFRVVIAGRPNVGKSSLFNALTGGAALVSSESGTTRDYLVGRVMLDDVTIELVDTAGAQESADAIESQAQSLGREQVEQADLALLCVEAGQPLAALSAAASTRVTIATKCDLTAPPVGLLATSTFSGAGLAELRQLLADRARLHVQSALAPSLSRCQGHVAACLEHLRRAHQIVLFEEPPELLALEVRGALDQIGEMVGVVYTDDLLDRIFSRFCIGK